MALATGAPPGNPIFQLCRRLRRRPTPPRQHRQPPPHRQVHTFHKRRLHDATPTQVAQFRLQRFKRAPAHHAFDARQFPPPIGFDELTIQQCSCHLPFMFLRACDFDPGSKVGGQTIEV